jgi:hypothetical protein
MSGQVGVFVTSLKFAYRMGNLFFVSKLSDENSDICQIANCKACDLVLGRCTPPRSPWTSVKLSGD